jgi:NADH-quinone oxidoreductase subunit G
MEAALRSAYFLLNGKNLDKVELTQIRGLEGVKVAEIPINGKSVRVAVAHGLNHVEYVLDKVREAEQKGEEPPYHFIEVMACLGGCVGGGGQPYGVTDELREKRAAGIYQDDKEKERRCSHDNPFVQQLYKEFLGKPLSEKSEHLLHTHYQARKVYAK